MDHSTSGSLLDLNIKGPFSTQNGLLRRRIKGRPLSCRQSPASLPSTWTDSAWRPPPGTAPWRSWRTRRNSPRGCSGPVTTIMTTWLMWLNSEKMNKARMMSYKLHCTLVQCFELKWHVWIHMSAFSMPAIQSIQIVLNYFDCLCHKSQMCD